MEALAILVIGGLGLVVFCQALKHSWEQWYYGRLNRKTLERWSKERH
jgi:hypothetical protein